MADGSILAAKEIDADETQVEKPKRSASKRVGTPSRKYKQRKFKVDLWATDFNTAEIGIMKRTQNEAASDQFTKDMDIIGQTVDGGKREALIAYRKELWDKNKDFDRRLVIKLFSETLGWRGTMEMMVGRSLQLSTGAGVPVPAFSLNLSRHEQIIEVERCARKWPFLPERFTFFIQGKSGPRFYSLRRKMFSIGADYRLFDHQGRHIGGIDHRIINLGGARIVRIDAAHSNAKLETVLELFSAMLKFNRASKRHVGKLCRKVRDGKISPTLTHREKNLYYNPRRRR
ncbi:MAG: hypothetical protein AAF583_12095 [Pseudomonadota bacterium]